MIYTYHYDSPLGGITLSSNGTKLTGLWFDRQKYFGDTIPKEYQEKRLPIFEQTVRWLDIYFSGKVPGFTPPLLMQTTSFRKTIWEIMLTIPYGKTMTYGEIADKIAKKKITKTDRITRLLKNPYISHIYAIHPAFWLHIY